MGKINFNSKPVRLRPAGEQPYRFRIILHRYLLIEHIPPCLLLDLVISATDLICKFANLTI